MAKSKSTVASPNRFISKSSVLDGWTLRLATIAGAVQVAGAIAIEESRKADDRMQHASDIIDLAVGEIERLRTDIAGVCSREIAHG